MQNIENLLFVTFLRLKNATLFNFSFLFTSLTSLLKIYYVILVIFTLLYVLAYTCIVNYSGLIQVTVFLLSIITFIYLLGVLILIPGTFISTKNYKDVIHTYLSRMKYSLLFLKKFPFYYLFRLYMFIILLLIIMDLLLNNMFILNSINYSIKNIYSFILPEGGASDNPTDPVRYWPSGIPQGMGVIGTGLAVFSVLSKIGNCSPRLRVLGALGATGVSATTITYHSAIENPVGFNRFMFGLTKFRETGQWPSLESIKNQVTETQISEFVAKHIHNANQELVKETVSEIQKLIEKGNTFVPETSTDLINKFMDTIFKNTIQVIKPVYVEGHFDDLIGQQIIIHIILFILVISLILLFLFYIINNMFVLNKDKILNKFDNKFIKLYIKYQSFLAKLSLIYLPVFILVGLLILCHGFYFLIKYQIPYESLNIDLHTFVSSKYKN